jgi:hypothetical protein
VRELEAMRRLGVELEAMVGASTGTIPAAALLDAFEQHTSILPSESQLHGQFRAVSRGLVRGGSDQIAESRVRKVIVILRRRADHLGRWVDARDDRLKQKSRGR